MKRKKIKNNHRATSRNFFQTDIRRMDKRERFADMFRRVSIRKAV